MQNTQFYVNCETLSNKLQELAEIYVIALTPVELNKYKETLQLLLQ